MSKLLMWDDGVYRDFTAEELAQYELDKVEKQNQFKNSVRLTRNQLLAETDWTQAKDVPDAVSAKWAPYRQALRDVPQQAGFPDNVTWPTKPE